GPARESRDKRPRPNVETRQVRVDSVDSETDHELHNIASPRPTAVDNHDASPPSSLAFHMAQLHLHDPTRTANTPSPSPALPHPASPVAPTADEWHALRTLIRLVQPPAAVVPTPVAPSPSPPIAEPRPPPSTQVPQPSRPLAASLPTAPPPTHPTFVSPAPPAPTPPPPPTASPAGDGAHHPWNHPTGHPSAPPPTPVY
ncbi:unnamed protein product, partial [Pylaiella littoralis]